MLESVQEATRSKAKLKKSVKEMQPDDSVIQTTPRDGIEENRKKKRRKRPKTAETELDREAADIIKDKTQTEQDLVQANLYTNDKNKSLEKETKHSYSDALNEWQQTVESAEKPRGQSSRDDGRREKRNKQKPSADAVSGFETAANVEKVRRRLKKKPREGRGVDGVDGASRSEQEPRGNAGDTAAEDNLAFEDGENERGGVRKARRKTRAKENVGFQDDVEDNNVQETEESQADKKKAVKKRRKKLKETSADVIHRALETKRTDDGNVLCIVVHKADRLKTDLRISHPLVRVHMLDVDTGQYVKKCSRNRAVTSYYENQETIDHVLPLMTEPFDFKQRKSLVPSWEDVLIINEIYSYFLQREPEDPKVIVLFEVLDFLSMNAISKLKNSQRSDRGWYQIAWAFLKLVGSNGAPNTDTKIRLQLFHPVKSYRRKVPTSSSEVPEVYSWWLSSSRVPYPSTLYVTVKGVRPPECIDAAGRSMFAIQEERGKMTLDELTDKVGRGGVSPSSQDASENAVAWAKLPGQPNHIPNRLMCTLQAGRRGCFVVKFSNDGRKLACACADKDNFSVYIFDTLSSRCSNKLQGHFSIIYDVCWSRDDKELVSASSDGTARSWDVSGDGGLASKLYPHPCFVYAARYHPARGNIVVTGGYDCLLRIWDKESGDANGQLLREMDGHRGFINTICFDPSGQFMYSGDSTGTILLWNTFQYNESKSKKRRSTVEDDVQRWVVSKTVRDPEIRDCIVNSVNLHPNGRKLLVHTRDSLTRMLDMRSFSVMTRYIGSNNFKEHIRSTLSTCGSFVFSGSEDGLVHVWDTETGELLKVYSDLGYTAAVSDVDFHPYDNIIAFCSFGENHPVVLYKYEITGGKDVPPATFPSTSTAALLSTTHPTRTLGQTTSETLTQEQRATQRTTMADVASETLLLNKIKKKLDSVLEVSSTSTRLHSGIAGSRAFSPERSSRSPFPASPDNFPRGMVSLSTWGSDFSTTLYDATTTAESPGITRTQSTKPGAAVNENLLSPGEGKSNVSKAGSSERTNESMPKAQAMYSFEARVADELSFRDGDIITVIREVDENWWYGETGDGVQGHFPTSYVVLLDEKSKRKEKSGKHSKSKENKHYTAVRTGTGDVKILSAPEDSDGDLIVHKRSRTGGRSPRDTRQNVDISRSSSSARKKSPRRTKDESMA